MVGGLQAQTLEGKWIDVTPVPNSFAVNIGDVLEGWSKHLGEESGTATLRSTPHRVINKSSDQHRLSIAFFYEPNLEMEMPEGITLKRKGKEFKDVKAYGEHIFRAY